MSVVLSTICIIIFFRYYGGKNNPKLAKAIQKLTPKHRIYIEPYCGSCGMCLNKERSEIEIISDADREIYHLVKTMSDTVKGAMLKERLKAIEPDKQLFHEVRRQRLYGYTGLDDVEKATYIYYQLAFSFNACRTYYVGRKKEEYHRWVCKNIDRVYERLQGVDVRNMDAIDLISQYKGNEEVLMRIDPPYCTWLRSAKEVYGVDAMVSHQLRLMKELTTGEIKANIMLFGYHSPNGESDLYDNALLPKGWIRYLLADVPKSAANVKPGEEKPRGQEYIWLSPDYPLPYDIEDYIDVSTKTRWEDLFNE